MLLEAKEQVKKGEWQDWLQHNFHLSHNTAKIYMKLAEVEKANALAFEVAIRRQLPITHLHPSSTRTLRLYAETRLTRRLRGQQTHPQRYRKAS
jgi:hypothetical protein